MKNVMVTGGSGFIGSHFIRYFLKKHPRSTILNVDLLTYCGNQENLKDVEDSPRYSFRQADIGEYADMLRLIWKNDIDTIVNFAAESDNNKAVKSPLEFAKTNAFGTAALLEAARIGDVERFHHISTCEVFGELPLSSTKKFLETSQYRPRTPYNASKAAGDLIVKSYHSTFGMPITISHSANNYGTHQFPEKVIPVFALKAFGDETLPVFKSLHNK